MSDIDVDAGTVRVERTIDAPAEAVFDAWTNPEVLRRWFKPEPTHELAAADVDLRVGGAYRVVVHDVDSGDDFAAFGTYREITRPQRLVYSWIWEGTGPYAGHETEVAVTFAEQQPGRTTVTIEHAGLLDDEASQEDHRRGWTGLLDSLASVGPELAAR
ncbi:MAG TPA: SRPBCC domain-containing protein [Conexibacter sp.]|nr:SRPBCC domain-containing protein [Conexibacter sp.]